MAALEHLEWGVSNGFEWEQNGLHWEDLNYICGVLYIERSKIVSTEMVAFETAVHSRWPRAEIKVGKWEELDDKEYIAIFNTAEKENTNISF